MKKRSLALIAMLASVAHAAEFSDMATVKQVTPRYIEINRPISSCQNTSEATPPKENVSRVRSSVVSPVDYWVVVSVKATVK